jgi:hypothetical protein
MFNTSWDMTAVPLSVGKRLAVLGPHAVSRRDLMEGIFFKKNGEHDLFFCARLLPSQGCLIFFARLLLLSSPLFLFLLFFFILFFSSSNCSFLHVISF